VIFEFVTPRPEALRGERCWQKKPAERLPHREAPGRISPVNYRMLVPPTTRAATEPAVDRLVGRLNRSGRRGDLTGDVSVVRVVD
jgi:hypothetical protein